MDKAIHRMFLRFPKLDILYYINHICFVCAYITIHLHRYHLTLPVLVKLEAFSYSEI